MSVILQNNDQEPDSEKITVPAEKSRGVFFTPVTN